LPKYKNESGGFYWLIKWVKLFTSTLIFLFIFVNIEKIIFLAISNFLKHFYDNFKEQLNHQLDFFFTNTIRLVNNYTQGLLYNILIENEKNCLLAILIMINQSIMMLFTPKFKYWTFCLKNITDCIRIQTEPCPNPWYICSRTFDIGYFYFNLNSLN